MFALCRSISFSPAYALTVFRASAIRYPYFLSRKESSSEATEAPVYDDEYMNPFVFDW